MSSLDNQDNLGAAPPPPPVNRRMSAMGQVNISAMEQEGSMKAAQQAQVEVARRQSARIANIPGADTMDQLASELNVIGNFFAELEAKDAAEQIARVQAHFKDGKFDAHGYCDEWDVKSKKIQEVSIVNALNIYAPIQNEDIIMNFVHLYGKEKGPWDTAGFGTMMHPSVVMNGCEHGTSVCLEHTLYGLCIGSCFFGCYIGCKTACCPMQSMTGMLARKEVVEKEIEKRMVKHWDNVFKSGVSEGQINLNMPQEDFKNKHQHAIARGPADDLATKLKAAYSIVSPADWENM